MAGTASQGYVFDNASTYATEQHICLAELFDPLTTARLATGTTIGDGWRCLDVGAGGGSVARWLAERVAPGGEVVATDIEPTRIPPTPGLTVLRHDVVTDPLPGTFDLICARLVLQHIPQRRVALRRLVGALRPGGWLLVDEFDIGYGGLLLPPVPRIEELYRAYLAAKARVFQDAGGDPTFGRYVSGWLHEEGLVDIDPRMEVQVWRGGSTGARLQLHHTESARDRFLAAGLSEEQLAEVRELLRDPAVVFTAPVRYSILARRPGG